MIVADGYKAGPSSPPKYRHKSNTPIAIKTKKRRLILRSCPLGQKCYSPTRPQHTLTLLSNDETNNSDTICSPDSRCISTGSYTSQIQTGDVACCSLCEYLLAHRTINSDGL